MCAWVNNCKRLTVPSVQQPQTGSIRFAHFITLQIGIIPYTCFGIIVGASEPFKVPSHLTKPVYDLTCI